MAVTNKRTVLIADDDVLVRRRIKKILADTEFAIVGEASDGVTAIEQCRSLRPEVALLDIRMPVLDGIGAARLLTEQQLVKCVIMLTSYEDRSYLDQAIEAGSSGYLLKPADAETVASTMRICLARAKEYRSAKKQLEKLRRRTQERGLFNQAKLYLMEEKGMTESTAFSYLNEISKKKKISQEQAAKYLLESVKQR